MRSFVAIELPGTILRELARRQAEFAASVSAAGAAEGVRWARPESIHLTLKFLGEVSGATAREVSGALKALEPFPSFKVDVRGFGFFPDSKRPRVFWAGITVGPDLTELASKIETVAGSFGIPAEGRPFSPHLTLARFRDSRPQPALQGLANDSASLGEFRVSEFCLFESRLRGGTPPEYRKIACFPLHS